MDKNSNSLISIHHLHGPHSPFLNHWLHISSWEIFKPAPTPAAIFNLESNTSLILLLVLPPPKQHPILPTHLICCWSPDPCCCSHSLNHSSELLFNKLYIRFQFCCPNPKTPFSHHQCTCWSIMVLVKQSFNFKSLILFKSLCSLSLLSSSVF